jgi:nitrite reductase (NADH) small subunit/3-phenylpropionate/trans-cinnamate dioxygenase ferredoxin subunit
MEKIVKVIKTALVATDTPSVVEVSGYRIAIYQEDDHFYALEDVCPHMGALLSRGFREPGVTICPWHNWQFDLRTGQCLTQPDCAVRTFPVQIIDEEIWLTVPQDPDELTTEELSSDWL